MSCDIWTVTTIVSTIMDSSIRNIIIIILIIDLYSAISMAHNALQWNVLKSKIYIRNLHQL